MASAVEAQNGIAHNLESCGFQVEVIVKDRDGLIVARLSDDGGYRFLSVHERIYSEWPCSSVLVSQVLRSLGIGEMIENMPVGRTLTLSSFGCRQASVNWRHTGFSA